MDSSYWILDEFLRSCLHSKEAEYKAKSGIRHHAISVIHSYAACARLHRTQSWPSFEKYSIKQPRLVQYYLYLIDIYQYN